MTAPEAYWYHLQASSSGELLGRMVAGVTQSGRSRSVTQSHENRLLDRLLPSPYRGKCGDGLGHPVACLGRDYVEHLGGYRGGLEVC